MDKKERAGLSRKQKAVLIALFVVAAWQVLQNDKITNALAALLFGGVVPGTNKVLAPETVMYIAGGVAVLVAFLVTIHFARRHKRLHPKPQYPESDTFVTEQPQPAATQEPEFIHVPIEAPQTVAVQQPVTKKSRRAKMPTLPVPRTSLAPLLTTSGRYGQGLARVLRTLSAGALHASKTAAVLARKGGNAAQKNLAKAAVATWRWASPYLWQFDRWLERRVREVQKWGRKKAHQHEDAQLLFDISRKSVKLMNQFAAKSVKKFSLTQQKSIEKEPED